ncbi:MAG: site-specific DNA-methyltransferase [Pirellulales bacterium]|nr:site-specific DNA-methyltransferase [Pirellulales bacterium]
MTQRQLAFIEHEKCEGTSTFASNMSLPVHRWFRYSAGFSAKWAEWTIGEYARQKRHTTVLDPFAGSATSLLAAEEMHVPCYGIESHPFVARLARAKLLRRSDPTKYKQLSERVLKKAKSRKQGSAKYPDLIQRCFTREHLVSLDKLRCSFEECADKSSASELTWLTLVSILRSSSHVGTAQWQYVLPKKTKRNVLHPFDAFAKFSSTVYRDMQISQEVPELARLLETDARTCKGVPDDSIGLVITSPPYPNNYDYADATRLEMMFFREIGGWSDLQQSVRRYLIRSCSQHTTTKNTNIEHLLHSDELLPILQEITPVVNELSEVRKTKGGKKNYHLMITAYFYDLAQVWNSLRRVCEEDCNVCFVIGDSAPYGVYVPVVEWLGSLAMSSGFKEWKFEKIRDRNIKWKNRKHRVPLCEGHLWVKG